RSGRLPASIRQSSPKRLPCRRPTPTNSPGGPRKSSRHKLRGGEKRACYLGYASGMSPYALELDRITVTFHSPENPGQRYTAVADTTLRIRAGEFVSVVGPTGCGKSTLLNIAA